MRPEIWRMSSPGSSHPIRRPRPQTARRFSQAICPEKKGFGPSKWRTDVGTQRDLQQTATPPAFDLDFPKDWQERVKNRSRAHDDGKGKSHYEGA